MPTFHIADQCNQPVLLALLKKNVPGVAAVLNTMSAHYKTTMWMHLRQLGTYKSLLVESFFSSQSVQ